MFEQAVLLMAENLILLIQNNIIISRIKLILPQMTRNKSDLIFTSRAVCPVITPLLTWAGN